MKQAVFLTLLVAGLVGLLATGSGLWPSPPWPWLALVALALGYRVAEQRAVAQKRLARRTEKRLQGLEEGLLAHGRSLDTSLAALREHVDTVGTPEGMKKFRDTVQAMAADLVELKDWAQKQQTSANFTRIRGG